MGNRQGLLLILVAVAITGYARLSVPAGEQMDIGVEALHQFQVGNGGHSSADTAYFPDQQR